MTRAPNLEKHEKEVPTYDMDHIIDHMYRLDKFTIPGPHLALGGPGYQRTAPIPLFAHPSVPSAKRRVPS